MYTLMFWDTLTLSQSLGQFVWIANFYVYAGRVYPSTELPKWVSRPVILSKLLTWDCQSSIHHIWHLMIFTSLFVKTLWFWSCIAIQLNGAVHQRASATWVTVNKKKLYPLSTHLIVHIPFSVSAITVFHNSDLALKCLAHSLADNKSLHNL